MTIDLHGRSFLTELDQTPDEWDFLLELSAQLKAAKEKQGEGALDELLRTGDTWEVK